MMKFRSVLAILLALVTAFMLNVGSVAAAKVKKPQTYTPAQLERIQEYASTLQATRDRLPELATLIQQQDWTFTRNFIHGPLGELRSDMSALIRNLLPDAQPSARLLAKTVFDDLIAIDTAAQAGDYKKAIRNYAETLRDFDAFTAILPKA